MDERLGMGIKINQTFLKFLMKIIYLMIYALPTAPAIMKLKIQFYLLILMYIFIIIQKQNLIQLLIMILNLRFL